MCKVQFIGPPTQLILLKLELEQNFTPFQITLNFYETITSARDKERFIFRGRAFEVGFCDYFQFQTNSPSKHAHLEFFLLSKHVTEVEVECGFIRDVLLGCHEHRYRLISVTWW